MQAKEHKVRQREEKTYRHVEEVEDRATFDIRRLLERKNLSERLWMRPLGNHNPLQVDVSLQLRYLVKLDGGTLW